MKLQIDFKTTLLAMLLTVAPALGLAAGGDGSGTSNGGGGSILQCRANGTASFPKDGMYALDYVLAVGTGKVWYEYSSDFQTELDAVIRVFKDKLQPYMWNDVIPISSAIEFDKIWQPLMTPLAPTHDQASGKIPPNCNKDVFQLTTAYQDTYFYDVRLYNSMLSDGQVAQINAHKMHEYLRSLFRDSNTVAAWNAVIHTRGFFSMSQKELVQLLSSHEVNLLSARAVLEGNLRIQAKEIIKKARTTSEGHDNIASFFNSEMDTKSRELDALQSQIRLIENSRQVVQEEQLCILARSQEELLRKISDRAHDIALEIADVYTAKRQFSDDYMGFELPESVREAFQLGGKARQLSFNLGCPRN